MIAIKRAYEPAAVRDGRRFLVDRLWPRGVSKVALKIDGWLKDVAPSDKLRKWFNHDPAKWPEFQRRYVEELKAAPESWRELKQAAAKGKVTLVFAAHDVDHNNAVALKSFLEKRGKSAKQSPARKLS